MKLFINLNNHKFPHEIHRYLFNDPSIAYEEKRDQIKQQLKLWYQHTFQKNNRWNRTQLYAHIKNYSTQELERLSECFELLFNSNNQYHQVFIRYIKEYTGQREAINSALGTNRLKVDQETFKDIIKYYGDLKREGKIKNTNKQIARILKLMIHPDRSLEETTIVDRLLNKKGYY